MEKVFLKPTSYEVNIKGNSKEGHTDVFSYDYHDDESKRKLGGLYIIGSVKQDENAANNSERGDSPDIAYVTNLVASLAKREYYSIPDATPREAFAATLKKINDVVEEFFKNKVLKVNIGVFAIAGEQIFISKLGKFKIILGRDSRTVDILNNIDLFNKETAQEKEFSGIVSGKVMHGDKLFAFYPNRMITAREKAIKADLLKFDREQFLGKINSIKETKPDFECDGLYLNLSNHKESASTKKPKTIIPGHLEVSANTIKSDVKNSEAVPAIEEKDKSSANSNLESPEPISEIPRIISSEFSLGRKTNPLLASLAIPIKIVRDLYAQNINLKKKFIILSLVAGILLSGVFLIKAFIVIDPEQRQLNAAADEARKNLKIVKTKINQNDLIGARQLLASSLSGIYAIGAKNEGTEKTVNEVYEVLDNIDGAVDVSPSLLETIPAELNQRISVLNTQTDGIAFDVYENNLYILKPDNILKIADIDKSGNKEAVQWFKSGPPAQAGTLPSQPTAIAVDGNVYVMNGTGALAVFYKGEKVSETNTLIVSNEKDVLLTSKNSDKLYLVNKALARIYELDKKSGSLTRTLKVGSSEPFVDAYLLGDSTIIITTKDGRIWEIKQF